MHPVYRQAVLRHTTLAELATSPNAGDLLGAGVLRPSAPEGPSTPPTPLAPRFDLTPPPAEGSSPGDQIGQAFGRGLGGAMGVLVIGGAGVLLGVGLAYLWR